MVITVSAIEALPSSAEMVVDSPSWSVVFAALSVTVGATSSSSSVKVALFTLTVSELAVARLLDAVPEIVIVRFT